MRFVADENIPNSLIKAIRRKGYSVKDLKEDNLAGIDDFELISLAKKEKRIIITFDKDFTDLTRFPINEHQGVVVLRYKNKHADNVVPQFCYLLDSPIKKKFENSLCEVFDNYVKVRKE